MVYFKESAKLNIIDSRFGTMYKNGYYTRAQDLDAATEPEDEMESAFFLDVVV